MRKPKIVVFDGDGVSSVESAEEAREKMLAAVGRSESFHAAVYAAGLGMLFSAGGQRESKRKEGKQKTDRALQDLVAKMLKRAWSMYREWYLRVPKRERPRKRDVEQDIANRLNKEFPQHPVKPRTVHGWLSSQNSGKF